MPELADLFPDFASHWLDTSAGRIFARSGGTGPPLLLLHGFPQTHVCWHRIAPQLSKKFTIIVMDLRGYGWSSAPDDDEAHTVYSKREMAKDVVEGMSALGYPRFHLAGHDRGARVAYRLAVDHPGRVDRLALLDILPTEAMWSGMDGASAMQVYHWLFLAQPSPLPEMLIGPKAREYLDHTLASWTASKDLKAFDGRALAHYRAFFENPSRIAACCADYRAGASTDRAADIASKAAGDRILSPTLVLYGEAGIPAGAADLSSAWQPWCSSLQVQSVACGHFLAEEAPAETANALIAHFES